ncbi:GNAT family N-acetyltransferase [Tengunoibacter tsumagoiensis]|uniref:GNAT family acetyltransferase n=1 Tax=Tengunoibacter tsumagoiensis TaxID=2014871 RepID=A0A401ZYD6_9CHLR|nr:GNAT family N-acetyltransferase [Tengunoibacter tsumagoiensis]GCE11843.1 GNAT family acetyltransferase [Tengunoibacter tsumagoiensis]
MMTQPVLPDGFTTRAARWSDLEEVCEVMRACDHQLFGRSEVTVQVMEREWSSPDFDLTHDCWVILAPEGKVIAVASLEQEAYVQLFAVGFVHPEYERRGLGSYLMSLIEERAQQMVALAPPEARVTLRIGANENHVAKQQLLIRHGYNLTRHFWRMKIELNEAPPAPQWPPNMELRPFTWEMERIVFDVAEEAFQDHWGHLPQSFEQWQHWLTKNPTFDPTLWYLPTSGEEIAGLALCSLDEGNGWVNELAIRRPWRRHGLALALLHHAFGEFYRRGIKDVYLYVDAESLTGATRLYEKAGMHVFRVTNRYIKELRAGIELSTEMLEV